MVTCEEDIDSVHRRNGRVLHGTHGFRSPLLDVPNGLAILNANDCGHV